MRGIRARRALALLALLALTLPGCAQSMASTTTPDGPRAALVRAKATQTADCSPRFSKASAGIA